MQIVQIKLTPVSQRREDKEHAAVRIELWCILKSVTESCSIQSTVEIGNMPDDDLPPEAIDRALSWLEDINNVQNLFDAIHELIELNV